MSRLDRAALGLYWSSLVLGVLVPWALDLGFHGPGLGRRLFAPGRNVFLIGVLHWIPFAIFGGLALFHLGTADRAEPRIAPRRLAGVTGAGLALLGTSLWVQVSILLSRSSTAALGYLFLPVELLGAAALGYAGGRLAATWWVRRPG